MTVSLSGSIYVTSGGVKGELGMEQAAKRPKVGVAADRAKGSGRSSDPGAVASPRAEMMVDKNKIVDSVVSHSPKSSTALVLHESASFKQHIRPLAAVGPPFLMNRYKLDNRPTAFRIVPPLPAGLADVSLSFSPSSLLTLHPVACTIYKVAVLKEHFSSYGDLSAVELEDCEVHDCVNGLDTEKNCSARIAFTTRRSAERAFQNGKCWQGHSLQFTWLMSSGSGNDLGNRENSLSALKGSLDADVQKEEKSACNVSQEGTADTEISSSAHKGSSDADVQEDENLVCIVSQEGAASGNMESENSERRSSVEHAESHEVSQPSPTAMSGEEESPKDNVC
ncbi:hypothetical protein Patl1_02808 [Pistacia atlantica]|uniref:Uncharacterized protein n=1 Tax=Pistacia atlantica TaxID=434234 RepID=A0ACC1CDY0_9ROSI|nr:hypothetical protein Patl1_02808 [Pistacia atlantica]